MARLFQPENCQGRRSDGAAGSCDGPTSGWVERAVAQAWRVFWDGVSGCTPLARSVAQADGVRLHHWVTGPKCERTDTKLEVIDWTTGEILTADAAFADKRGATWMQSLPDW